MESTLIDVITREVSIPIEAGVMIKDLSKHDDYQVKKVNRAGIILEHKPLIRSEKKDDLLISYDELVHTFSKGRFFIAGFSKIIENGYEHDLDKLKRAVKDTVSKIKLEEEQIELEKVLAQKSELEREKEEAAKIIAATLKEKALLEQDKLRVMDEKESLIQKRKSKLRSKITRQEEEMAREEKNRKDKLEAERIENEQRMIREYKIKILKKKSSSQQQRFRLMMKSI